MHRPPRPPGPRRVRKRVGPLPGHAGAHCCALQRSAALQRRTVRRARGPTPLLPDLKGVPRRRRFQAHVDVLARPLLHLRPAHARRGLRGGPHPGPQSLPRRHAVRGVRGPAPRGAAAGHAAVDLPRAGPRLRSALPLGAGPPRGDASSRARGGLAPRKPRHGGCSANPGAQVLARTRLRPSSCGSGARTPAASGARRAARAGARGACRGARQRPDARRRAPSSPRPAARRRPGGPPRKRR